ncbi:MAG: hypothetical protein NZ761_10445 [Dehalococcoidia bacterium]|nr:hypothetical protein [Dehalococcoidia bacterium]
MNGDDMASRVAGYALALARGEDWPLDDLSRVFPDTERDRSTLIVTGFTGIRTALYPGMDPIAAVVALGYAIFGETWPSVPEMRRAFEVVRTEWGKEVSAARRRSEKHERT